MEQIAERAFVHIAAELTELGYPSELVAACTRIAEDERRHAGLCASLSKELGAPEPALVPVRVTLAPAGLSREDALAYDIVARSCIAETESTATLLELLPGAVGSVHSVVHAIATDEVRHARLGWQFLAHVKGRRDLAFLGPHLPAMLETGGAPLFEPSSASVGDADDAPNGTLALATQRRIFVQVLAEVVFPGFELHGIPTDHARAWLAAQHRRLDAA